MDEPHVDSDDSDAAGAGGLQTVRFPSSRSVTDYQRPGSKLSYRREETWPENCVLKDKRKVAGLNGGLIN
jgi:hypothetical protein